MKLLEIILSWLRCDRCGASTNTQGSWDTPITILCEECSKVTQK